MDDALMCGIWASVGAAVPRAVIDAVAHRGPDGEGWREFPAPAGPVVLAHRRLAIIDTDRRGLQPMSDGAGRFWVTYNGEIYNYQDLRAELRGLGHRFVTDTDTEVLLAAYVAWGEACLERLEGMFAFVLLDLERRALFAARDRFGIKPLYYWTGPQMLAFASEIKQLAALPGFRAALNRPRALDFLADGVTDHTDETLFAGVRQLRGGQCLTASLEAPAPPAAPAPRDWYRLPEPETRIMSREEASARFRDLFTASVRAHLRSDVPLGSCLSGGIDSSSIVCVLADLLGDDGARAAQATVSMVFDDPGIDERRHVQAVLERTGVRNHPVTPSGEEVAAAMASGARSQDEPFSSSSVLGQRAVFRRAAEAGLKVMLDGQGADELLGGYDGMYPYFHAGLLRGLRLRRLWRELRAHTRADGSALGAQGRALAGIASPWLAGAWRLLHGRRAGERHLPAWLDADGFGGGEARRPLIETVLARDGRGMPATLGDQCRAMVTRIGLPMLLRFEDRNSMAFGIEARVPFLDRGLAELAIALGSEHKIVDGTRKCVLRDAVRGVVPDSVLARRDKIGFATPEQRWLRGPLREAGAAAVDAALARFPDLFHAQRLREHRDRVLAGRGPFDAAVWRVASFGAWGGAFEVGA